MKKFEFTLQPLYSYKQTVEKLQKAELRKARQALSELLGEERRLIGLYDNAARALEDALRRGENLAAEFCEYDKYFRYLREALEQLRVKISKAEDFKNKCEARLITTMKEIKTYVKLREEQYQEYQKETQAEEEKNMGDIVSYDVVSKGTNQ